MNTTPRSVPGLGRLEQEGGEPVELRNPVFYDFR